MDIIAGAQAYLRSRGVDQWQDGYPDQAVMLNDIRNENSYVLKDDANRVLGIATIVVGDEPTYARIYNGAWKTPEPYACIHRVAVRSDLRGTGTAVEMMIAAENIISSRGIQSIRIDTHRNNVSMRKMLEKCGFICCGIVYLKGGAESGAERIALEKSIN